jgi:adenylyltransferase/sulfurtransferase
MQELTPDEIRRYARHLIMPEVGGSGQRKLKEAAVAIVGLGGLGSPAAYYLAAAGVGRLGLIDFDSVDESNLQRQIIHFQKDVGRSKTESAAEKLRGVNPHISLDIFEEPISSKNALRILENYDIVVDGTDNFPTRYLINDACVLLGKPNVYGSIFRFEGQAGVFALPDGPCYRCLYPQPPPPGEVPSCAEAGVLGVLPGIVGCIQANEAIKIILGIGDPLSGSLLHFDALSMAFRKLRVQKDPRCSLCGENRTIHELIDYDSFCGINKGPAGIPSVTVEELAAKRESGEPFVLLDVREEDELEISRLDPMLHIPMHQLVMRMGELDKNDEILIICRAGNRSGQITQLLMSLGFGNVKNVDGGLNAYAERVDTSLAIY